MLDKNNNEFKFTFIDLFAGIGGFRLGCEANGGRCVFSSEIDRYSCDTYEENFNERPQGDITKIDIANIFDHDILCGGFPCQTFSTGGKRLGFEDTRGTLIYEIFRILKEKRPKAFILENVTGLLSHDGGKTFYVIRKLLGKNFNLMNEWNVNKDNLGYNVFYKVLNSADFGLAQNRNRIFIVGFTDAVKNRNKFRFPKFTDKTKVIKDILEKEVSDGYYFKGYEIEELMERLSKYSNSIFSPNFELIGKNKKSRTIASSYCNAKHSFFHSYFDEKNENIKTNQFSEKQKVRIFTPRECARLQGFPEWFKLNKNERQAYKQLGNAVSPPVIEAIVRNIIKVL